MKIKGYKNSTFSIVGALIFFATIAIVMQIAILVYDYIIERTRNNALIAVLILIVIILLSLVCTLIDIIRRKLMVDKPVHKILVATEKIAAGDFSARVDIEHSYEKYDSYDEIAENVNKMSAELGKSELLKKDFISNVSHEIKTPLAIIRSYAVSLGKSDISDEERAACSETIVRAADRLSALVSNILSLSKLENQAIKPQRERVNLTEQLAESALSYEDLIEKKEIILSCDLDDVYINSVGSYLEIIWNNLISNAVKFTDPGGRITILLRECEGGASVSVSDTGCGISPEVGNKIFEKFYQADASHAAEGNGLGLALVKSVIELLGGTITVDSKPGVGSTFNIYLRNLE